MGALLATTMPLHPRATVSRLLATTTVHHPLSMAIVLILLATTTVVRPLATAMDLATVLVTEVATDLAFPPMDLAYLATDPATLATLATLDPHLPTITHGKQRLAKVNLILLLSVEKN